MDKPPSQEELNLSWDICRARGYKVEVAATPSDKVSATPSDLPSRPPSAKRAAPAENLLPNKAQKAPKSLPPTVPAGPSQAFQDRYSALSIEPQYLHYLDVASLSAGRGFWLAKESSCPQISCGYLVLSNAPANLAGEFLSVGVATVAFGSALQPLLPLGGQLINWASLRDASPHRSVALDQILNDEPFVHICVPLQTPVISAVPEAPKRDSPHLCPVSILLPGGLASPHIGYYVSGAFATRLRRAKCIGVVRFYVWAAAEVALACQHIQRVIQDRLNLHTPPGTFSILVIPSFMRHQIKLASPVDLEIVFHVYLEGGDNPIPRDLAARLRDEAPGDNSLKVQGAIYTGAGSFILYATAQQFRNSPSDARLSPPASSSSSLVDSRGMLNYGCLLLFSAGSFRSATLAQFLTFLASLMPDDSLSPMLGQGAGWLAHRAIKIDGKPDPAVPGFLVYADAEMPTFLLAKAQSLVPDLTVQSLGVSPLEPHRQALMGHLNGISTSMFPLTAANVKAGFTGLPPTSGNPGSASVTVELGGLRAALTAVEEQLEEIQDTVARGGRHGDNLEASIAEMSTALQGIRDELESSQLRLSALERNQTNMAQALAALSPLLTSFRQSPTTPAAAAGAAPTLSSELVASLQAIVLEAAAAVPSTPAAVGRDLTSAAELGSLEPEAVNLLSLWPPDLPYCFEPSFMQSGTILDEDPVQDNSLQLQFSAGPDLPPSPDASPLQWRLVGLDWAGVGVSIHLPASLALVKQMGDAATLWEGVRDYAQVAVYLFCEAAVPLDTAPSGGITWTPTYLSGWFRCTGTLSTTMLSTGPHVGLMDGKYVALPSPALLKVKAIVQQTLFAHRSTLAGVLSRLMFNSKMVLAEVGIYSVKIQLNAAAFSAACSADSSAVDRIWAACRDSPCSLTVRLPEAGENLYPRFNILHAVAGVLHEMRSSDSSSPPAFLKADTSFTGVPTKLAPKSRDAFTALFEDNIPVAKSADWQAFLSYLVDGRMTAAATLALTDSVLQDHLEEWEFNVPFLLRKSGSHTARLFSSGRGMYSLDAILALNNQLAICINQPAPSFSASTAGAKRTVNPTTALVTTLSPPAAELQAAIIAAVFSAVPDEIRTLPPQLRCLATMGLLPPDPLTHES